MIDSSRLRGEIYRKYKSKSAFADAIGWSRQKLAYALEHPEKLRLEQVQEIINGLELQGDPHAACIFLPIAFKSA